MSKHTPTPWNGCDDFITGAMHGRCHSSAAGVVYANHIIAWMEKEDADRSANAAFIVRACNAHDELVAALERTLEILDAWGPERRGDTLERLHERITAALSKARGTP